MVVFTVFLGGMNFGIEGFFVFIYIGIIFVSGRFERGFGFRGELILALTKFSEHLL